MRNARVRMDFDAKYATETDPWSIGDAIGPRYDLYRMRLLSLAGERKSILDIGSGFGAFLARFRDDFDHAQAIEVAASAVTRGSGRYPWIDFMVGSAAELAATPANERQYDAIVCSDVLYYLDHAQRRQAVEWIASHLEPGGVALIAAYCPGGRYLTQDELEVLVDPRLVILEQHCLDSGHVAVVHAGRRALAALTVDYETWQPIPAGRRSTGTPTCSARPIACWRRAIDNGHR